MGSLSPADRRKKRYRVPIRERSIVIGMAAVDKYEQDLFIRKPVFLHNIRYGDPIRKLLVPDVEPADLERCEKLYREIDHV